jgi:PadR family transcriptional regulator, regulatory protein PadR
MSKTPNALLHGALDALILKTLARGPSHGYAIGRFIEETSGEAVLVEEGSLYPALYRLERRGSLEAEWGTSELGRRAKRYWLTGAGLDQLRAETATWRRFSDARRDANTRARRTRHGSENRPRVGNQPPR